MDQARATTASSCLSLKELEDAQLDSEASKLCDAGLDVVSDAQVDSSMAKSGLKYSLTDSIVETQKPSNMEEQECLNIDLNLN
ncbi:hypothetical protein ACH5RR_037085, partial [Cinchona calisaya]